MGFGLVSPVGGERPGLADVAAARLEESERGRRWLLPGRGRFPGTAGGGFGVARPHCPTARAPFDLHEITLGGTALSLTPRWRRRRSRCAAGHGPGLLPAPQMPQRQRRLGAYGGKGHVSEPWQPGRFAQLVAGTGVARYRGARTPARPVPPAGQRGRSPCVPGRRLRQRARALRPPAGATGNWRSLVHGRHERPGPGHGLPGHRTPGRTIRTPFQRRLRPPPAPR